MTDYTDLVKRLRAYAKNQGGWHNIDDTCEEAADAIEAQANRIEELEKDNKHLLDACKSHVPVMYRLFEHKARIAELEAALDECKKVSYIAMREGWDGEVAAKIGFRISGIVRSTLNPKTLEEKVTPDWNDLRGCAPEATGDLSSEDFVRKLRDEDWR